MSEEGFEGGGEQPPEVSGGEEGVGKEEGSEGVSGRKIYMCLRCGRIFSPEDMITPGVHCPYCGYRVLVKVRTFLTKRIAHVE